MWYKNFIEYTQKENRPINASDNNNVKSKQKTYKHTTIAISIFIIALLTTGTFTPILMLKIDNKAHALPQLQFPKLQQADLAVINSGNPPPTSNLNVTQGYTIEPIL